VQKSDSWSFNERVTENPDFDDETGCGPVLSGALLNNKISTNVVSSLELPGSISAEAFCLNGENERR
jgi:hypothetical protein